MREDSILTGNNRGGSGGDIGISGGRCWKNRRAFRGFPSPSHFELRKAKQAMLAPTICQRVVGVALLLRQEWVLRATHSWDVFVS